MRRCSWILGIIVLAVLSSVRCTPTTKLVNSWTAPDVNKASVKKVLVLGIARDLPIRRAYEDEFVKTLQGLKYEAVASYNWIPDMPKELDKDMLRQKMKENGVTHVIATRVVDEKTVTSYIPPSYSTAGPYYPGWYGSYYSYWSVGYSGVYSPGYTTVSQVVSLETNLYDVSTEKLLWTGITDTWVGDDRFENVDPVIRKVVYDLRTKKVI
jgi:hypothetical protein